MRRQLHLPTYTFTVTIFLIHHHKTPIQSANGGTCFAREILVSAPSAISDTVRYLSSLMFLFGTCARYPEGNETKSGRVFRASWDHVEDGILTRAVLDSGPGYYLLLGVYLCHEMFFGFFFSPSCTAMASAMSTARASEPHQTAISKPLSWLFRKGDAGTKAGYWQLVHFVAPLRFPNDACALIEITAN